MTPSYRELAEEFGTPLYVYDGELMLATLTDLRARLHPALEVFYSLKANPNIAVVALLRSGGARAEVSSLVELRTALAAGVPPADVIFLGPGKSEAELAECVRSGVYAVVCESIDELARLDRHVERHAPPGRRQRVLLRINPSRAVTGARLTMGGRPRQFGIDESAVLALRAPAGRHRNLDIAGIQVYQGTRILDAAVIAENVASVLELADLVAERTGLPLDAVDVGGGLGVPYFDGEPELDLAALAAAVNPALDAFVTAHPGARLLMESGRFLTALAGTYVMSVRYVKESMGQRFAVTDGGTHHHMAAVGIGSYVKRNFPIALLSRTSTEPVEPWQITGPLCTPNDTVGRNVALPPLRVGDLLGVQRSGAYGPSASPGLFLSHGYPAEVLLRHGRAHLVRARDEPEDLLRPQRLPDLTLAETTRS